MKPENAARYLALRDIKLYRVTPRPGARGPNGRPYKKGWLAVSGAGTAWWIEVSEDDTALAPTLTLARIQRAVAELPDSWHIRTRKGLTKKFAIKWVRP